MRFAWGALWVALWGLAAFAEPSDGLLVRRPESKGAIVGRVCEDLNRNGRCEAKEPGIAGARLVLETGQAVRTDLEGRYHLAALATRAPDTDVLGRFTFGRHRLGVDPRSLPAGAAVSEGSVTVDLPLGGLAVRDFAVRVPRAHAAPLRFEPKQAPPSGRLRGGRIQFLLTGRASPGVRVRVEGQAAKVDAKGGYRAWIALRPGENGVSIAVRDAAGSERLYRQRIDVVSRPGGVLVVPRAPKLEATIRLPATAARKASAGQSALRIEALPGTKISGPEGAVVVGADGVGRLPVRLSSGDNAVPVELARPDGTKVSATLAIPARNRAFVVGLVDLVGTFDLRSGGVRLFGRGAAHAEAHWAGLDFAGELSLDDADVRAVDAQGLPVLMYPRFPQSPERALDPDQTAFVFGDDSVTTVPNAVGGRLRLSVRKKGLGALEVGEHRVHFSDGELGRYQRRIFGAALELHAPGKWPVKGALRLFDGASLFDPTRSIGTVPVHQVFPTTGGSLYYLRKGAIAQGSEVVRIVFRDGVTRTPLAERHLVRGRDYEIDYSSGRILLRAPLALTASPAVLHSLPVTAGVEPVLVVDAARLAIEGSAPRVFGGEVEASFAGIHLTVGGLDQRGGDGYRLLRAKAGIPVGPLRLWVEVAQSRGSLFAAGDFARSDDGGFDFEQPTLSPDASGQALEVRLKGPSPLKGGTVDVAYRRTTPGYTDGAHVDPLGMHDLYVRLAQRVGHLDFGLKLDDFRGADPRIAFENETFGAREEGGSVGWVAENWSAHLELRHSSLSAVPSLGAAPEAGAETSVGVAGSLRVSSKLTLLASHLQSLSRTGAGPGGFDDTFSAVGFRLALPKTTVSLRGGYGPKLGPQVTGGAQFHAGANTYYGAYSVDVDGPDFGTSRAVSGVSTRVGDSSAVFVEDVAAHDATALRLSHAVGVTQSLAKGLTVSARYERGARSPLGAVPELRRDGAGAGVEWVTPRVKASVRAEVRFDRGRDDGVAVKRLQRVVSFAVTSELTAHLSGSARLNWGDTSNYDVRESRFLEGGAGLSWRSGPFVALLEYGVERELLPPVRGFGERSSQVLSLMPALAISSRLRVSAGAHLGHWTDGAAHGWTAAFSLRPSVRVWHGLELAVEGARRTASPDGGGLSALRGEVGWRFDSHALVAVGYTFFGYSGLGLSPTPAGQQDRLYVRAELGI